MAKYREVPLPADPAAVLEKIKKGVVSGTSVEFYNSVDGTIRMILWIDKKLRLGQHEKVK